MSTFIPQKIGMKDQIEAMVLAKKGTITIPFKMPPKNIEVRCINDHVTNLKPKEFIDLGEEWCKECLLSSSKTNNYVEENLIENQIPFSRKVEFPKDSNIFFDYFIEIDNSVYLIDLDKKEKFDKAEKEKIIEKMICASENMVKLAVIDYSASKNKDVVNNFLYSFWSSPEDVMCTNQALYDEDNYDIKIEEDDKLTDVSENISPIEELTSKEQNKEKREEWMEKKFGKYLIQPIGEQPNPNHKYRGYFKIPHFQNIENLPIAYGYVRCSTYESQANKGFSLETQEMEIMKYCQENNYFLKFIAYDAGRSGLEMTKRPSLIRLLKDIDERSLVVCMEMSRFSRDQRDYLNIVYEIENIRKCSIYYIKDANLDTRTVEGMINQSINTLKNKMESIEISKRTKMAMRAAAERGELKSRPVYGWRFIKKKYPFEKDEFEQGVISRIRDIKEKNPGYTFQDIIDELIKLRISPPRKAKAWYPATIKNIMLQNGIIEPYVRKNNFPPNKCI